MSHLQDKSIMGEIFPLKDICPFTTMGLFNRNLTDSNRKIIAAKLANLLGVNEPIPDSFAGIPLLNNQNLGSLVMKSHATLMTLNACGKCSRRQ